MLRTEPQGQGGLAPPRSGGMETTMRGSRSSPTDGRRLVGDAGDGTVEIDLGTPCCQEESGCGMTRPPLFENSDDVFIPDGELLEEARKGAQGVVKKNVYPGDWRIQVGLVAIVLSTYYLFCYDIVFPWIEDPHQQLFPIPDMFAYPIWYLSTGVMVMCFISYAVACSVSPGSPPPNWKPTTSIEGIAPHYDPFSPNKKIRWCEYCENHKPPRAHHCKICGICVLRGDHHCMWTANCVGYRNHKAFFLFLWYLGTLIWLGIMISALRLLNLVFFEFGWKFVYEKVLDDVVVLMLFFFCTGFQSYVGGMFQEQVQLLFSNVTTIEKRDISAWKKCRDDELKRTNVKRKLIWPYQDPDGALANAASVFTDGLWWVPFPTLPPPLSQDPDGGMSFGYHPEFAQKVLSSEEVAKQQEWEDEKMSPPAYHDLAEFSGFRVGKGFEEGKDA